MSISSPRKGRSADGFTTGSGYILLAVGASGFIACACAVGAVGAVGGDELAGILIPIALALFFAAVFALGVVLTAAGRAQQRKSAFILTQGIPLIARVVDARRTGNEEGDVPMYSLSLEVDAPSGKYITTTNRFLAEHEVARLLDQEVRVRVHPDERGEVVIDDVQ